MIGYNINSDMPPIAIAVGCSSIITLDFSYFSCAEDEKIIFSFKNSTLKDAPVIFATTIDLADLDENNQIEIVVDETVANELTEKSFYTFTAEAADGTRRKLTDNGRIVLQYGAFGGSGEAVRLNNEDINEFRW